MKIVLLLFLLLSFTSNVFASNKETDIEQIANTLNDYLEGTSMGVKPQISRAFIDDANLYLSKLEQPLWTVPVKQYIGWFSPQSNPTRMGKISQIDISGNIATAKLELFMPRGNAFYIDMFILKKIDNQWKILSKTAQKMENQFTGKRVLFVMSNAHFHGNSDLPAGVSFSELVEAYDVFTKAGYFVDFVSPNGGAVPLSYINTSDNAHKTYLYDADMMFQLKHTFKPSDISAKDYVAIHYLGGSNAMYGVAENNQLQDIAMAIYEQQNGVISSVCHGTAGIVNLKNSDGSYLVSGKQITGYPDEFEAKDRPYYQSFPFSIEQRITDQGGKFSYGKRNESHVKVDGRIVTGTNYQSSRDVAMAMLEILQ
jgi:putative intracellular protease/amidase